MPSVPRKAWNSAVKAMSRPRHRPMAASWSQTTVRGRAPNWPSTCRCPPSTSWALRDGIIQAPMKRLKPATPTITHNLADWPWPRAMSASGCHRSNWASSPGR